jgi:hypothetical protein
MSVAASPGGRLIVDVFRLMASTLAVGLASILAPDLTEANRAGSTFGEL